MLRGKDMPLLDPKGSRAVPLVLHALRLTFGKRICLP